MKIVFAADFGIYSVKDEYILGKTPTKTETTQYGVKHTYHTTLVGKNGQSIRCSTVGSRV